MPCSRTINRREGNTPHYYSVAEVAALADCSRIYVQKSIERGNLVSFRRGQHRTAAHVIPTEDAARFLSEVQMRRTLRATGAYHKSQEVS